MKDKKLVLSILMVLLIAVILAAGACTPAPSSTPVSTPTATTVKSEPIKLKFASGFMDTNGHSLRQIAWMNKIEKDTNGRVIFEKFFGGTLVSQRESSTQIAQGVADLGMSSAVFSSQNKILAGTEQMFFKIQDRALAGRIWLDLLAKFPEIEKEYGSNTKILGYGATLNPNLLTRKPVRVMDDLKNMQIRAAASTLNLITALGGTPIDITPGDLYIALQKGTIDGALGDITQLEGLKLKEVVKYVTYIRLGMRANPCIEMNLKVWNNLPKEIQQVFLNNVSFIVNEYVTGWEKELQPAVDGGKNAGVEFIELSKEERAKYDQMIDKFQLSEANRLEAQGIQAKAMLEYVNQLYKQYSK